MDTRDPAQRHFTCANRTFELRTTRSGDEVVVDCFENGKPTGVRGRVDLAIESDFATYGLGNAGVVLADAIERYVRDILNPTS